MISTDEPMIRTNKSFNLEVNWSLMAELRGLDWIDIKEEEAEAGGRRHYNLATNPSRIKKPLPKEISSCK